MAVTDSFEWRGLRLPYADHAYNTTRLNERAVELPIAKAFLAAQPTGARGLEVGNVLGHYGTSGHRVVDLFEQAPGVENIDVADVTGSFDWIVAVSTLEHVGWDYGVTEPARALAALLHLQGLLTPTGRMLVTIPTGHHPVLDLLIAERLIPGLTWDATYRRAGDGWEETPEPTILPYGATTPWAEAVWVAILGPRGDQHPAGSVRYDPAL